MMKLKPSHSDLDQIAAEASRTIGSAAHQNMMVDGEMKQNVYLPETAASITKSACEKAVQAFLCGDSAAHASEQVAEEIWKQANIVCALSGAVAHDCDHHGITRPTWWKAVKKLQKLVNQCFPWEGAADNRVRTVATNIQRPIPASDTVVTDGLGSMGKIKRKPDTASEQSDNTNRLLGAAKIHLVEKTEWSENLLREAIDAMHEGKV